jgi:hypothetical protein
MTEAEWICCSDPQRMIDYLCTMKHFGERKARLFGVACCRRLWPLLEDERSRRAVLFQEEQVDGRLDSKARESIQREAHYAAGEFNRRIAQSGSARERLKRMAAASAATAAAMVLQDSSVWRLTTPAQQAAKAVAFVAAVAQKHAALLDGKPGRPPARSERVAQATKR